MRTLALISLIGTLAAMHAQASAPAIFNAAPELKISGGPVFKGAGLTIYKGTSKRLEAPAFLVVDEKSGKLSTLFVSKPVPGVACEIRYVDKQTKQSTAKMPGSNKECFDKSNLPEGTEKIVEDIHVGGIKDVFQSMLSKDQIRCVREELNALGAAESSAELASTAAARKPFEFTLYDNTSGKISDSYTSHIELLGDLHRDPEGIPHYASLLLGKKGCVTSSRADFEKQLRNLKSEDEQLARAKAQAQANEPKPVAPVTVDPNAVIRQIMGDAGADAASGPTAAPQSDASAPKSVVSTEDDAGSAESRDNADASSADAAADQ